MSSENEEIRPEDYVLKRDQVVNIVTISDFTREPLEIREKLKAGEDFVITWHKKALCYIRHLTESERESWATKSRLKEKLPLGIDGIMGMWSLRVDRRDEFIDSMHDGKVYVFSVYKKPMGLGSNRIPKRAEHMYNEWYEEEKKKESVIRKQARNK